PPVYGILVIIFLVSILLDLFFGIDDQLFIFNPTILTNILVRSVALGIVAVGQTFVMIGASIDLSVAYMISVTAVGASYLMAAEEGVDIVDCAFVPLSGVTAQPSLNALGEAMRFSGRDTTLG
ncbi:MAG TPA: hypothetical protein PKE20_07290, partial [Promineifilum sp.]|nr:hypothetical protein [Promineifilum sp.]